LPSQLAKDLWISLTAVLMLAFGIGATTPIFSIARSDSFMKRPNGEHFHISGNLAEI
jgi:hypothetical protein